MFFIEEKVAFNLSVTQSIPRVNGQIMKIKLSTFPHKQILREKNDWNIKFTRLKHDGKPVGLYENTS